MSVQTTTERPEVLMTPTEVAQLPNVSLSTVRREIDRGVLPACDVGRQLRIDHDDFRAAPDRGRDTPCRTQE